jgi:hypothetical protein
MPPPAERSLGRRAAQALLALLLVLAAIPAYLALDPWWQAVAVRVGCALAVMAGGLHLRRAVRRAIGEDARSPLDASPAPAPPPDLDGGYLRARDDVVWSTRSRRYFDAILWPRLLALAGGHLARPAARTGTRRGPSLRALERAIAQVERRP